MNFNNLDEVWNALKIFCVVSFVNPDVWFPETNKIGGVSCRFESHQSMSGNALDFSDFTSLEVLSSVVAMAPPLGNLQIGPCYTHDASVTITWTYINTVHLMTC
jgi:hypothetical protein